MYQGWAEYAYELWAFDGNGQAYTSDNRSVTFDINFGREEHQFDPEAIAGFFWELRGLLQDSILLASTENGEFQTGIPGLELQNYIFSDLLSLDSLEAMEASVRQQEAELDEQTVWSAPPEGGGLADAMASLPPRYREVLLLKYYNGYSAREIAGFLSATPDAVTQTLHRARKKLAEILDERGETP